MGNYCELYISKYPIAVSKNRIDAYLLSVFQQKDIHIGDLEQDGDYEISIQFVSSAKILKDRLNVMGFSLSHVKEIFEESKVEDIEKFYGYLRDDFANGFHENIKNKINLLKKSTFENFLDASKEIINNNYGFAIKKEDLPLSVSPLINYLLEDGLENFPNNDDLRVLLRYFLEIIPEDEQVIYDVSENFNLYYSVGPEDIYSEIVYNQDFIKNEFEIGDKFIILTEGTSDIYILENSLQLLYPHLVEFYSFMDFGNSNASGSASSLVSSIKSFIGAGFKNKIIAIFDNDTAAEDAKRALSKTKIPESIKILSYPNLKFAENYPTIGPTGESIVNINGLAGSIEIYLGKDILIKDNKPIPVHWKGYVQSLNKYQGEILEKEDIQDRFKSKIKQCRANAELIKEFDWSGINEIFKVIFNAFN